jgi:AraC-like DNA-binding protein
MLPIDEAIAFRDHQINLPIAEVARRFNVNRSTLSKRFQGKTGSLAKRAESNRLLSNKQELVLVEHIRRLSEWCLPPTPVMVTLWASVLCGSEPGKNWSTSFKARHKDILDSRYLNTINLARHKADSKASYEQLLRICLSCVLQPMAAWRECGCLHQDTAA